MAETFLLRFVWVFGARVFLAVAVSVSLALYSPAFRVGALWRKSVSVVDFFLVAPNDFELPWPLRRPLCLAFLECCLGLF